MKPAPSTNGAGTHESFIEWDEEAMATGDVSIDADREVVMPLQPTFWARTWGMLADRYGTPWIINGELLPD